MPSIFSIGLTLSRTMPSIWSSSLRRNSDWRALVGQHVLGLVDEPLRLGLDRRAHALRLRGDARLLGRLLGEQHFDGLAPAGDLALAHGDDLLLRLGRARACAFSASACAADCSSDF